MKTPGRMLKLTSRFNRKLRELYTTQKEKMLAIDKADAAAAAVILGEPMKHVGQKAAFGNDPIQEIHFDGIETPARYKLRMLPNEFATVAWRRNGELVRAWIKVESDGRWVVGEKQIIETNKEIRNERKTSSGSRRA